MFNFIRKHKLLTIGAVVIFLVALFPFQLIGLTSFLVPDPKWDPTPKQIDGVTVFDAHIPNHPGHFSFREKIAISSKIDVKAMLQGDRVEKLEEEWPTFYERTPLGSLAPDFDLETTDGKRVKLSDFAGTHVAIMFVAITCPPARLEVPRWETIGEKYSSDDVKVLFIYSREQHPGEPGYRNYMYPKTDDEKMRYAKELDALTAVDIAVDPITEETLKDYGIVPNAGFVIDRAGRVVFKTTWADSRKLEIVLDALLSMES